MYKVMWISYSGYCGLFGSFCFVVCLNNNIYTFFRCQPPAKNSKSFSKFSTVLILTQTEWVPFGLVSSVKGLAL